MIQIGGVYTTVCQQEGILLQKYRDRNGRCIAILFKSIGVRGRFDSPDVWVVLQLKCACQGEGYRTQSLRHPKPHSAGYGGTAERVFVGVSRGNTIRGNRTERF